jgi:hypothetical protein
MKIFHVESSHPQLPDIVLRGIQIPRDRAPASDLPERLALCDMSEYMHRIDFELTLILRVQFPVGGYASIMHTDHVSNPFLLLPFPGIPIRIKRMRVGFGNRSD